MRVPLPLKRESTFASSETEVSFCSSDPAKSALLSHPVITRSGYWVAHIERPAEKNFVNLSLVLVLLSSGKGHETTTPIAGDIQWAVLTIYLVPVKLHFITLF